MIDLDGPLVLVGAGKMGSALLAGWLDKGLDASRVIVQEPALDAAFRARLEGAGATVVSRLDAIEPPPAVVVLAVKPQVLGDVLREMAGQIPATALVVSIAAGRQLASIEALLAAGTPVVRAMPNTPAAVGRGITVCCANVHVGDAHRRLADGLMGAVGAVAWIEDEPHMDAVTAVSGSGPAYVFLLAECLAEAGVAAGLEAVLAHRLARETVTGAAALMESSAKEPRALRQDVTSPAGTTAAALEVLMGGDRLETLMTEAVAAATARSRALSR